MAKGANHAGEIPYGFDSQDKVPGRTPMLTAEDRAETTLVHSCWVSFVKTGAPVCEAGGKAWPAYHPETDELMEFGIQSGVVAHFRKAELDAQEKANAKLIGAK